MAKKKIVTKKIATGTKVSPTESKLARQTKVRSDGRGELVFGKKNYIWMSAGVLLIFLGMLLMVGGSMPSPDVWDDSIIYSFRRITLAPILILAGLAIEIVAIFK